jgi:glycosyltransferase involved in cell wall biosynthesis
MFLQKKTLLYIFDAADWDSRFALACAAKEQGANVVIGLIGVKEGDEINAPDMKIVLLRKKQGIIRGIVTPLSMLHDIRKIIIGEKPDIIHAVTLKYSFITALAALGIGVSHKIFTIAGLGYLYRSDDVMSVALRYMLWPFLLFTFRRNKTCLIFQNADDRALLIGNKIAAEETSYLIKGSGVYLDRFDVSKNTPQSSPPLIFMPTRLVHEKGVAVFIEAARMLKNKGIKARFEIAGGLTRDNPRAITREQMESMIKDGAVTWLGRIDNIPAKLKEATLIVYPSYYGEGIPRVLLEACAAGRPIITTDHPGCREAVDHGKSGLLVPVKDHEAIAQAIELLLANPEQLIEMGNYARKKAEQEFDIHEIVRQTLEAYKSI